MSNLPTAPKKNEIRQTHRLVRYSKTTVALVLVLALILQNLIFIHSASASIERGWTVQTTDTTQPLRDVAYGGHNVVAVAEGVRGWGPPGSSTPGLPGKVLRLTNDTWTSSTLGADTSSWYAVAYGNGKFLTGMTNGESVFQSTDSTTWTAAPNSFQTNALVYGSSMFVGVGRLGNIQTTGDASAGVWTKRLDLTSTHSFSDVAYGSGVYVAVGYQPNVGSSGVSGMVVRSSDGVNWTKLQSPTNNFISGITYAGNQFIAVGNNGTVLTSGDGLAWSSHTDASLGNLNKVAYGFNEIVAVGNNGKIWHSLNEGLTWHNSPSGITTNFNQVRFLNNRFYIVGDSGVVLAGYPLDIEPPTATAATLSTLANITLTDMLEGSSTDQDPVTYSIVDSTDAHGLVTLDSVTGALTYVPQTDFNGQSSFTYKVSDRGLDSNIATVTINVGPVIPLSTEKDLTSFSINNVNAVFSESGLAHLANVTLPFGTALIHLAAEFATTGDHVKVNGSLAVSGDYYDFTNSVSFAVYAEDNSFKIYDVTVVNAEETHNTTPTNESPTQTSSPTPTPLATPAPTPTPVPTAVPTVTPTPVPFYNEKVSLEAVKAIAEKAKSAKTVTFTDLPANAPNAKAIVLAAKLGIIKGYEDGSFHADATVTRAEFATMLVNALGLTSTSNDTFTDSKGNWAEHAINTLKSSGIINGYLDGSFKPNQNISREEIVSMLSKVLNTTSIPKPTKFSDVSNSWASSAISTLSDIGIVNGANDTTFKPKANATRSESLMMILRMLNISLGLSLDIE